MTVFIALKSLFIKQNLWEKTPHKIGKTHGLENLCINI